MEKPACFGNILVELGRLSTCCSIASINVLYKNHYTFLWQFSEASIFLAIHYIPFKYVCMYVCMYVCVCMCV